MAAPSARFERVRRSSPTEPAPAASIRSLKTQLSPVRPAATTVACCAGKTPIANRLLKTQPQTHGSSLPTKTKRRTWPTWQTWQTSKKQMFFTEKTLCDPSQRRKATNRAPPQFVSVEPSRRRIERPAATGLASDVAGGALQPRWKEPGSSGACVHQRPSAVPCISLANLGVLGGCLRFSTTQQPTRLLRQNEAPFVNPKPRSERVITPPRRAINHGPNLLKSVVLAGPPDNHGEPARPNEEGSQRVDR